MSKNCTLQEKVATLYRHISDHHYRNRPDMEVDGQQHNSTLAFGLMGEILRANVLFYGEYGGGKTTVSEYLHALTHGLPLDLVKNAVLRGDPQQTKESMIALPNYGAMNANDKDWASKPFWTHFVLLPPKIVDEFNRIPEPNQSILLNGAERGDWDYIRGHYSTGNSPLFATANYADNGNNTIIPPILDRFAVAVESKFPGVLHALDLAQSFENEYDDAIAGTELTKKAIELMEAKESEGAILESLEREIVTPFSEELEGKNIPYLTRVELDEARQAASSIPLNKDAEMYLALTFAELNISVSKGQKRSLENPDKDSGNYLGNLFMGSTSRRTEKSIMHFAKTYAWLTGAEEVKPEHIATVAPYCTWHKITYRPDVMASFEGTPRDDPAKLHVSRQLFLGGNQEFGGVYTRFGETKEGLQNFFDILSSTDPQRHQKAQQYLQQMQNGNSGHPIYFDLARDLTNYDA